MNWKNKTKYQMPKKLRSIID